MKEVKKENLEQLLDFIEEICNKDEFQWFKISLLNNLSTDNGFENFPEFIKYQKKQFKLKANIFYKNITDSKLKNQLVNDYIEMSWYQSINRTERFLLFVFYQVENLLNYYIKKSNAHIKIKSNRSKYFIEYSKSFKVDSYKSFINYKGENISINKINIWAKITYWVIDSNSIVWEKSNHSTISNLINVRNNQSHRNSQNENKNVDNILLFHKKADFSSLGFYIQVIKKIYETI